MTEKFCNLDAATDIGIDIGAEDVLEIEKDDKEYLKVGIYFLTPFFNQFHFYIHPR